MARNLNETCIFNLKSDPPFWTVIVETDWGSLTPGDKCFDLNWKAADTFWKIYSINHTNNFEILEENLVSTQYIKGRWGNLDNVGGITINGLYAIKVNVHVTSKYWFNKYYLLKVSVYELLISIRKDLHLKKLILRIKNDILYFSN